MINLSVENSKIHVSKGNRKLGKGVYSISFMPGDEPITLKDGTVLTNVKGTCKGVCDGCKNVCYAIKFIKLYSTTLKAWGENTLLLRNDIDKFYSSIDAYIYKHKSIKEWRWHVSGEVESYEQLVYMNAIALRHPQIQFGIYTKQFDMVHKFGDEHGKQAPNFAINLSLWKDNMKDHKDLIRCGYYNIFGYDDGDYNYREEYGFDKVVHCPAVGKDHHSTGVKCVNCHRCYTNNGSVTFVINH